MDPPYWGTAGYVTPFEEADYARLRDALSQIAGRFVLSINDRPEVRQVFSGFAQKRIRTTYSTANARTHAGSRAAPRRELLIHNLPT